MTGVMGVGRSRPPARHQLDAAGHYRRIRDLTPLPAGTLDVGGCTLYIGAGLKAAMRTAYRGTLARIAADLGLERTGRLAVCPTVVQGRFAPYAWRLVDPDGREVGARNG